MLVSVPSPERPRLDRNRWHEPLVSVVVTHHNYSDHIEDALLSVLDQTHPNWECVVIDDASDADHLRRLQAILQRIDSPRIRLFVQEDNTGQIPAFYHGLDVSYGEFVCLLDPDDRYDQTFMADMLDAHLNETVYCPIACADQIVLRNDEQITGIYSPLPLRFLKKDRRSGYVPLPDMPSDRMFYIPPHKRGWHWTSTSAMMFRRAACQLMRPHRKLAYKRAADSYLAKGAHMLGGTLRLTRPLVYRSVHPDNSYMSDAVFATVQGKRKPGGTAVGHLCRLDVIEAIKANGGEHHLIKTSRRWGLARLKRSLAKRWRNLTGRVVE